MEFTRGARKLSGTERLSLIIVSTVTCRTRGFTPSTSSLAPLPFSTPQHRCSSTQCNYWPQARPLCKIALIFTLYALNILLYEYAESWSIRVLSSSCRDACCDITRVRYQKGPSTLTGDPWSSVSTRNLARRKQCGRVILPGQA